MKTSSLIYLSLLASTCVAFSEVVPSEVTRLEERRADAIRKIDETHIKELEKIKVIFTKIARLEEALAVDARIKKLQEQLGTGADAYPKRDKVSESSIVGEYNYTYLSNAHRETWVLKKGGDVKFGSAGKSDQLGQWELKNNVLIIKKPGKPKLIYHFPTDSLVSSKIEGDKKAAMIQKK